MVLKNKFFKKNNILNCRGKLIKLDHPQVMGIINLSPESFYEGSKFTEENAILKQVEHVLKAGATFIDIGAMSSKPGSHFIPVEQEIERLVPVVKLVCKTFPEALVSVDTCRAKTAHACLDEGARVINDISAGTIDEEIMALAAKYGSPMILMHMAGTPETMQKNPVYDDIVQDVITFFVERIEKARAAGVLDLIIDPGFGFGKTIAHNYQLLANLDDLKIFKLPVLVGLSRKSMIWKTIAKDANRALNGTTAAHMAALMGGADIIRVHDVEEAMETIRIYGELNPWQVHEVSGNQ